jgi:hypothetical protein
MAEYDFVKHYAAWSTKQEQSARDSIPSFRPPTKISMQFVIPTLPSQNPTIYHKTISYITGSLVDSDMDGVSRIGFCSELAGIQSEGTAS